GCQAWASRLAWRCTVLAQPAGAGRGAAPAGASGTAASGGGAPPVCGVSTTPGRTGTAPPRAGEAAERQRPEGCAGGAGGRCTTAGDSTAVTPEQRKSRGADRRDGGAEFTNTGRDVSAPAALPGNTREEGQNCGSEAGLHHGREDDYRGRA